MKPTKLIFTFMALATISFSCSSSDPDPTPDPTPGPVDGGIVLDISTNAIKSDGKDYCDFNVKAGDTDVTDKAEIYVVGTTTPLTSARYTSTQQGNVSFFASYNGNVSSQVNIKVLPEIPELPTDAQPENTNFKRRVLALQFTGTACPNCPYMIGAIHEVQKTDVAEKVLFAGIHSYNYDDIMYNKSAAAIGQSFGNGYYPGVSCDMRKEVLNAVGSITLTASKLETLINNAHADNARAGISGSVIRSGNQIIVKASVKAAQTGNYRISAWVLENGIYAKQSNSTGVTSYDFDTHNNVLRAVASNVNDYTGDDLGEIQSGATKSYVMSINVDSEWKLEKCKVLLFVTTPDAGGSAKKYYVNNAVLCNLDQVVMYEYR